MLKISSTPPKLESIAFNTISLELWKQAADIVSEMKHLYESHNVSDSQLIISEEWSKSRQRVVDKVSRLSLPHLMKQKMNESIDMIGLGMRIWLEKVIDLLPSTNIPDYIRLISLNSDGGIDRKKTATSILKAMPNLDINSRYCFACINFVEDDVRSLWKELPDERKTDLGELFYTDRFVIYWSCYLSEEFDFLYKIIERDTRRNDNDVNDYFIRRSIITSNSAAFKYFWERLSEEQRWKNTVKYALELTKMNITIDMGTIIDELYVDLAGDSKDIYQYLVSQLNDVQLQQMVQQDPYATMHFWFWCEYWQKGLISLDSLWSFIFPTAYCEFLDTLVHYHMIHASDSEFFVLKCRTIFKELWKNTPNNIKREFFKNVDDKLIEFILDSFLINADVEILQLIFDDATVDEKKDIINYSICRRDLFRDVLQYKCHFYVTQRACMMRTHIREEDIEEFLEDVVASFNVKGTKGDTWPLLNTLHKWKKRNAT